MPNWVTNKLQTSERVISAMLNEAGEIDFNTAAPFPGPNDEWDAISMDAEMAAKVVCGTPVDSHPLIGALQASNRERINLRTMREDCFKQFIGMLENYRACGYLHSMDFARKVWGTKWNACRPKAEPAEGRCEFETAWSCPEGVLKKVSERFPDDTITVTFADENIGSNCGTFTLKAGQIVEQNIAPRWRDLDDAGKARWRDFAYQVTGRQPEPEEEA